MMSGAKVQNSVHSCTIRYLTLGPAKYKKGFFMNRKLLFFDIDGTLLAGGIPGYIPDSAIEALTGKWTLYFHQQWTHIRIYARSN